MLTDTADYALRATLYLASQPGRGRVPAAAVAEALGLPPNYLGKTLRTLVKAGVLESERGPGGGFALAVAPEELPLSRVVDPFARFGERERCLLGREDCDDRKPCPAHDRWAEVTRHVEEFFERTTVADLLGRGGRQMDGTDDEPRR